MSEANDATNNSDDDRCVCGTSHPCILSNDCDVCVCGDGSFGCKGCGTTHCCLSGICKNKIISCNKDVAPNGCYCYCKK